MSNCTCVMCRECDGTGEVWWGICGNYVGRAHCDDLDTMEPCEVCDGTGILDECDYCLYETDGWNDD
jgi:hypothetical protein